MGPIADRPATADLHTTYLSTDEGNGVLKAYLYTESGWMQMQGIEGFTGGGGGSSGNFIINITADDTDPTAYTNVVADKTLAEVIAAYESGLIPVVALSVSSDSGSTYILNCTLVSVRSGEYEASFAQVHVNPMPQSLDVFGKYIDWYEDDGENFEGYTTESTVALANV